MKNKTSPSLFAEEKPVEVTSPAKPAPKKSETAKPKSVAVITKMPPPAPQNMLAIIASAASNPLVDVQKMKELLAMQREIERDVQTREFNTAMLAAQADMPKIVRDKFNKGTDSKYASLEKVSADIDGIVRRHGFTMSFGTDDSPLAGHYRIICDLSHTGGMTRRYFADLQADIAGAKGTPNKTPVQAVGSTMSYGRRYLKVMIFDLAIVGEDKDGNKPAPELKTITHEQLEQISELAMAAGCPRERLVTYLDQHKPKDHPRLSELAALPETRFDAAVAAIRLWESSAEKGTPV